MRPGPKILLAMTLLPASAMAQQLTPATKSHNGLFWGEMIGLSLLWIAGTWAGISDANDRSRKAKIAIEGLTAYYREQDRFEPDL